MRIARIVGCEYSAYPNGFDSAITETFNILIEIRYRQSFSLFCRIVKDLFKYRKCRIDTITREQAMLILANAMKLTGLKGLAEGEHAATSIASYEDASQVAQWAMTGVADAVSSGIVQGRSDGRLAPQAKITRAEVVVMIERLLQNSGHINKE